MTVKELKEYLDDKDDNAKVLMWQYYEQEWYSINEWNLKIED